MQNDPRSRILLLLQLLLEQTDEHHYATGADILHFWETHGIQANRKNVYSDIQLLMEFGLDIICIKSTQNRYFIGSRLLELPELPKVPRMGLLLRHGTREEQETPETEATAAEAAPAPEETPAAEKISPAPAEETPVTKAPAAPEPEAYSVDEILREVHGGAPQADNAPTPAAPVYSGARVLERLLEDPEKLASDLDALTRAIQGLSDDLRRGAAESREGQVDR